MESWLLELSTFKTRKLPKTVKSSEQIQYNPFEKVCKPLKVMILKGFVCGCGLGYSVVFRA
ncbi:hypothetical protein GLIP_1504 [Aliiglaciecola lipolytica E3]|uniref:Uncharacterized protein n=1 Tax=Aliiglaciecola lipolytica E3 TaxID=1127673 RepID=K6YBW2_9ALTE|nr:hypothetical protein GLIP_1504 [Aliiglaciecola lipolytica E3]